MLTNRKQAVKVGTTLLMIASGFFVADVFNTKPNYPVPFLRATSELAASNIIIIEDNVEIEDTVFEDEELPPREYAPGETGSWANCTVLTRSEKSTFDNHPDEGSVMVSCHQINYRVPLVSFQKAAEEPVLYGILSNSGGTGPEFRDAIRSTWAKDKNGIFFLVAGPWSQISEEYNYYKDMIWIDEKETYDTVLTYKTQSFIAIAHEVSMKVNGKYDYLFKTDDDSFVNTQKVNEMLIGSRQDFVGQCYWPNQKEPNRDPKWKWSISKEIYPEPTFPTYCQGAGYALSRKFATCAVEGRHISETRFITHEDVSTGILAERCGVWVYNIPGIVTMRLNSRDEQNRVFWNWDKPEDDDWYPAANMQGKYVQHRIQNVQDMYDHQASLDRINGLE